jgi:hypothetical protein
MVPAELKHPRPKGAAVHWGFEYNRDLRNRLARQIAEEDHCDYPLDISIAGSQGVLTPTLIGAQPATFKLNGKTYPSSRKESVNALALLLSLDEKKRRQAVLQHCCRPCAGA